MAASASSSASKAASLKLKLLIDKKNQKVLFAEAGKDTVDFLFTILSLPVSAVIRLLSKKNMVGCIGNIYESIEKMEEDFIQPNQNKDNLLKPKTPISAIGSVPMLMIDSTTQTSSKTFYMCDKYNMHSCYNCTLRCGWIYVTDTEGVACPTCKKPMCTKLTFVDGDGGESSSDAKGISGVAAGGFVKGVVTYMVMDDLVVKPMSTISSITLLNQFNVKDVGGLEEKVVYLDMTKGLKLLKESMISKNVLTSVFLGNKNVKEDEEEDDKEDQRKRKARKTGGRGRGRGRR